MSKKNKNQNFFNEDLQHKCIYCAYSRYVEVGDLYFCMYKGPTEAEGCCKKYKYDILKRSPRKLRAGNDIDPTDFEL